MIDKLIEANKKMAKALLEEFAEFYPFAYSLNSLAEVRNIATMIDSETPSPLEVVKELEEVLAIAIKEYDIWAVSICLDVRIVPEGESEKSDALDIRINMANADPLEVFVPYMLNNGEVTFSDEEVHSGAKFVEFV
ncbi:MAG: hypothetical protein WC756_15545 [Taibaiella sp.]|jgi:hypothetical protein